MAAFIPGDMPPADADWDSGVPSFAAAEVVETLLDVPVPDPEAPAPPVVFSDRAVEAPVGDGDDVKESPETAFGDEVTVPVAEAPEFRDD